MSGSTVSLLTARISGFLLQLSKVSIDTQKRLALNDFLSQEVSSQLQGMKGPHIQYLCSRMGVQFWIQNISTDSPGADVFG